MVFPAAKVTTSRMYAQNLALERLVSDLPFDWAQISGNYTMQMTGLTYRHEFTRIYPPFRGFLQVIREEARWKVRP